MEVGLVTFLQSWDSLLIYCNNQFKKYIASLPKTSEECTLCPPFDVYVRSFLCLFSILIKICYSKVLKWSSPVRGPKAKSSYSEIKNPKSNIIHCKLSLPCPPPNSGIKPTSLLHWQLDSLPLVPPRNPI